MSAAIKSEAAAAYEAKPNSWAFTKAEQATIDKAHEIILRRFKNARGDALTKPSDTSKYLQVMFASEEREVFALLTLDNRNRTIELHPMFYGTIDGASVYPREVVKQALADNAAAVILCHNHPSGVAEPSQADIRITENLKQALGTVDIRVLDHIIVAERSTSMAEQGLV